MSKKAEGELPAAPPAEAFRKSVLASLEKKSAISRSTSTTANAGEPWTRTGKRRRSEISSTIPRSDEQEEDDDDGTEASEVVPPPPPPPPAVRRSSSVGGASLPASHPNATTNAAAATNQNPSSFANFTKKPQLVRRRSSLFDSLPGRSRGGGSLLSSLGGGGVPETRASPSSFFQRLSSQASTLMGDDLSTNLNGGDSNDNTTNNFTAMPLSSPSSGQCPPRGSLFGAVMGKLKAPPQPTETTTTAVNPGTPQPAPAAPPAGFMSPSGKSIMNIVNQFVKSPFRFSSPTKSKPKAKRRLQLSSSTLHKSPSSKKDDREDFLSTPQRKRARMSRTDTASTFTPSPQQHKRRIFTSPTTATATTPPSQKNLNLNEDSMSSLHDDENWREAPLCISPFPTNHQNGGNGGQAEILDWTLTSSSSSSSVKWQLECHPPEAITSIIHSREWREALGYWEYAPTMETVLVQPPLPELQKAQPEEEEDFSSTTQISKHKDRATAKPSLKRLSSTSSLTEKVSTTKQTTILEKENSTHTSNLNSANGSNNKNSDNRPAKDPAVLLATRLVRSVRASSSSSSAISRGAAAGVVKSKGGAAASTSTKAAESSRPAAAMLADGGKQQEDEEGASSSLLASQAQVREWKQSLRSLFFQWLQKWESAASGASDDNDQEEEDPNRRTIRKALLDYYFYSVLMTSDDDGGNQGNPTNDHVVLFRVDATPEPPYCTPRVLVSSSCGESFLQQLRDRGVETLQVLELPSTTKTSQHGGDGGIASPSPKDKSQQQEQLHAMSPTVKADLEALRKAQAYGEVAGADVSIKIKTKGNKGQSSNTSKKTKNGLAAATIKTAITLSGYDDVAAFWEVYWNCLGSVNDDDDNNRLSTTATTPFLQRRLPKLICPREMGPFWHSSLKSLDTRPVKPPKEEATQPKQQNLPPPSMRRSGTVEIQGSVILPSIIRRIVAVSAFKLSILHSKSGDNLTDATLQLVTSPSREAAGLNDPTQNNQKAGSYYVVLHAVPEEEKEGSILKSARLAATTVTREILRSKKNWMSEASIIFNDILSKKDGTVDEDHVENVSREKKIPECRSGTTLQLVVWDASRSNVAACKVGSLP